MNLIFLDVETTGTGPEDRLCEVAYRVRGTKGGVHDLFLPPLPVSIGAMSVTHITNKMLVGKLPFKESGEPYQWIKDHFDNGAVLVAHNAPFDKGMLEKEGITIPKFICTLKVAHFLDKDASLEKHNLQFLRYTFDLDGDDPIIGKAHGAMADVLVLERLFEHYAKQMSVEEMLEVSARPILLKKFQFGKYKGQRFDEVAKTREGWNYFLWMSANMEMDENLRYTVNQYLRVT